MLVFNDLGAVFVFVPAVGLGFAYLATQSLDAATGVALGLAVACDLGFRLLRRKAEQPGWGARLRRLVSPPAGGHFLFVPIWVLASALGVTLLLRRFL